ncbi:gag-polyprotein putative aspartyl protease domain-containing protein [Phthorimaea operculella]|nr:gag-polyprotein putative aspartyl protease domain-containing protein [Phthorimaea operculella]
MDIEILGSKGTGLLDSGAKGSIAGHSLHAFLQSKGHPLQTSTRNIKLADGFIRPTEVLVANVDVKILHKVVNLEFVILPESNDNETLLGMDFIKKARIVCDHIDQVWWFKGDDQLHELRYEGFVSTNNTNMHVFQNLDVNLLAETAYHAFATKAFLYILWLRWGPGSLLQIQTAGVHVPAEAAYNAKQLLLWRHCCITRDGPYVVTKKVSPTTYLIAPVDEPSKSLGKFHSKELTLFRGRVDDDHLPAPVVPKRNRGRPQRHVVDSDGPIEVADGAPEPQDVPVHERGRSHELEGEYIANQRLPLRASRAGVPCCCKLRNMCALVLKSIALRVGEITD